ncbi:hypothetical protein PTSG_12014 [Salpingoeca rosetta]|uniref:CCHC-type domain-containing protein n=1 Tax=Salpingoeca rosetta (strain ATCC 50818 / BSB-021) TaxID=946362 RepID=F2U514_SALR5|nr:uncharacterized protein PTSG_12014 [Salpingoeca rosetta]EGD82730.1 hypothetical protein PTSG_12014 [Salpingoeca rosetta]|eukprot:XP_004995966.1 hypothetical protein PTSG_12014 [Salpingoeca rosetta]
MLSILRQHGVGIPDPPKWMTATMAYKLLNLASKEFTPLLQRDLKNKARAAQRQLKKVAEHHDEGARFACEHTAELALYIGAAQHLARTLAPPDTDLTSFKIFPTFTNKHPFIQLDAGLLRYLTCCKCGRLGHSQRQCRQPAAVRPQPRQAPSLLDFLGADVARQFRKRRVTSIRTDGYTAYLLVEPSARRDTVCDTSPITPVVGVDPGTRIPLACVRIQDGKKMLVSQKRIANQLYTGRGRRHHKPTATVPARSGGSDEGGEQGGAMGKGETGSRRKKRERGKRTKRERSRRRKEKARIEKEEQLRRQQQEEQGGRDKGEGQEGRDKGEEEREQREREEQGGGAEPGSVDDVVASARECLREGVSRRELKWRLHEKLKHCRFRSRVAGELATRFGRDCRVFFGDCVHKGRGGGTKAPILELRRAIGCRVDTKIVEEFRTTKYSLCCAWPNRIDEQTRIATCTHCGASADRDVAAAKTIAARYGSM